MTIIELLQQVGAENVSIQRIDQSILSADTKSGITKLVIETNKFSASDLLALTEGNRPKNHGLILWIPWDKLAAP